MKIIHIPKKKNKTFRISFSDANTRNEIANNLSEIKGLTKKISIEGKMIPLMLNLLFVLGGLLIAVALTGIAYDASNGAEIQEFSGRRSGIKTILTLIATTLGPIGTGIVGGIVVIYLIWRLLARWKNPFNEITFN